MYYYCKIYNKYSIIQKIFTLYLYQYINKGDDKNIFIGITFIIVITLFVLNYNNNNKCKLTIE